MDELLKQALWNIKDFKDRFVQEIVEEYYPKALQKIDPEFESEDDAIGEAVHLFLHDMAFGRAKNIWASTNRDKLQSVLNDPEVLGFSYSELKEAPLTIKDAVTQIVGTLLLDKLFYHYKTDILHEGVKEALGLV